MIESLNAGGAERHVLDLHGELLRRGAESVVVAQPGVLASEQSITAVSARRRFFGWFRTLWRASTGSGPVVIHAHSLAPLPASWLVARLRRHRLCFTVHGWTPERLTAGRRMLRIFRPDVIIAVSRELAAATDGLGAPTHWVPNGVPDRWGEIDRVAQSGSRSTVFVNVGRFAHPKNQGGLLRSFARLRASGARARLILLGDGPDRDSLTSLARELGVQDAVDFRGFGDPLPALAEADAYVSASLSEGLSLAYLEAMMAGLPLIITATSGAADLVVDGVNGRLVPVDEDSKLAAALQQFCESPGLWDGAVSRSMYLDQYTHHRMVDALAEIYGDAR